eukprot:IDg8717t1
MPEYKLAPEHYDWKISPGWEQVSSMVRSANHAQRAAAHVPALLQHLSRVADLKDGVEHSTEHEHKQAALGFHGPYRAQHKSLEPHHRPHQGAAGTEPGPKALLRAGGFLKTQSKRKALSTRTAFRSSGRPSGPASCAPPRAPISAKLGQAVEHSVKKPYAMLDFWCRLPLRK